jgi:hypothetical protein
MAPRFRRKFTTLCQTGNDRRLGTQEYFTHGCGVSAEATHWLIDRGVKVMGIDSWGWDIPLPVQAIAFLDAGEAAVNVKSPVLQPGDELNPMLQAGTGCRLSAPSRDSPALC